MPDKKSVLLFSTTFVISIITYILAFDRFTVRAYMVGDRHIEIKPIWVAFAVSTVYTALILTAFIIYCKIKNTDGRLLGFHSVYLTLYGISGGSALASAVEFCFFSGFPDSTVPAFIAFISLIILGITISKHQKYMHDNDELPCIISGKISVSIAAIILLAVFKGFAVVGYYDALRKISPIVFHSYWVDDWLEYLIEFVLTAFGAVITGFIFRKANRLLYWSAAAAMILIYHKYFLYAFVGLLAIVFYFGEI